MIDSLMLGKTERAGEFYVLSGDVADRLKYLGVDGLLGVNLLRDYAVSLDFSKQECTLVYPGNLSPSLLTTLGFDASKNVAIPLREGGNGIDQIPLSLNGKTVAATLDSGARFTVFPKAQLPDHAKFIATTLARVEERVISVDIVRGNQIVLGDVSLSDYPVGMGKTSTGIVGMDVLSQLRLLLDFPTHTMYAAKSAEFYNASWTENQTRDIEDMAIVYWQGKRWRVAAIEGPGMFSKAGLKQNDIMIEINGTPITVEYPDALVNALTKQKSYTLTVLRGAKQEKVKCQVHRP